MEVDNKPHQGGLATGSCSAKFVSCSTSQPRTSGCWQVPPFCVTSEFCTGILYIISFIVLLFIAVVCKISDCVFFMEDMENNDVFLRQLW